MPASSSWVTGSMNWSPPPASSSSRLAVRPVTSRNTESASASSIARSRWASSRVTFHSIVGCWLEHLHAPARRARPARATARAPAPSPSAAGRRAGRARRTGRRAPSARPRSRGGRSGWRGRWRGGPDSTTYSASGGSPSSNSTSPRTSWRVSTTAASVSSVSGGASAKKSVSASTARGARGSFAMSARGYYAPSIAGNARTLPCASVTDAGPPAVVTVWTIVVAGGSGRRFGAAKQFAPLGGRRVIDVACDTRAPGERRGGGRAPARCRPGMVGDHG